MGSVDVVHIPVTISSSSLVEQSRALVVKVFPQWSASNLVSKLFTDGLTNQLIAWGPEDESHEKVLVRVYGEATSEIVDREAELRSMKWLSGHGQSSKVYATFENGFCYEYMPGYVLNVEDLVDPSTWPQIAQAMAHIHQLGLGDLKPEAGLFTMFDKFLALLPETPDIKQTLEPEVEFLKAGLPKPQPEDLVFCHNDLLARNVIKQKDKIIFIDFEYGCPNHRAFDIANHFTEFCGVGASYGKLPAPDRAFMQAWCKVYLSHIDQDADEATLEKLVTQVEAFIPSTHLLWAIWCFAQSSRTNFDYENYGNLRLRDYFLTKSNLDNVTN